MIKNDKMNFNSNSYRSVACNDAYISQEILQTHLAKLEFIIIKIKKKLIST